MTIILDENGDRVESETADAGDFMFISPSMPVLKRDVDAYVDSMEPFQPVLEQTVLKSGGDFSSENLRSLEDPPLVRDSSRILGEAPTVQVELDEQFSFGAENTVAANTKLRIAYSIRPAIQGSDEEIDIFNGEAFKLKNLISRAYKAQPQVLLRQVALYGPSPLTRDLVFIDVVSTESFRISDVFPDASQWQRSTDPRFGFIEAPSDFKPVLLTRVGVEVIQTQGWPKYPASGVLDLLTDVGNFVGDAIGSSAEASGEAIGKFLGGAVNTKTLAFVISLAIVGAIGFFVYKEVV